MNRFVKLERQVSVRTVRPIKVDCSRSVPEYSDRTEPKRTFTVDFRPAKFPEFLA